MTDGGNTSFGVDVNRDWRIYANPVDGYEMLGVVHEGKWDIGALARPDEVRFTEAFVLQTALLARVQATLSSGLSASMASSKRANTSCCDRATAWLGRRVSPSPLPGVCFTQ